MGIRVEHAILAMAFLLAGGVPCRGVEQDMVDPCFPRQLHAQQSQEEHVANELLPWRIRHLKAERDLLLNTIANLPLHNPTALPDHLGYHSVPISEESLGDAQQINVKFAFYSRLDSIALMPALISGTSGLKSYAFPKRFKIEVLENRGRWVGGTEAEGGRWQENKELAEWVEIVNWLDMDFPDPGPYPVFFQCSGQKVYQVRISFPEGEKTSVGEFHALGEIYVFRRDTAGHMSDNMMGWGKDVDIRASNSLSKPPLWDVQYLKDGFAGLGLPLSEETVEADDLMVSWKSGVPKRPVQIILDLGGIRQVGGVHLWPAEAPHGMAVPLFGFPGKVSVELSAYADFREVRTAEVRDARGRMHRDNLLIIATRAYDARYVRITLDDFPEYQRHRILGLGEISVVEYSNIWSTGCRVSATGLPEGSLDQLPRLVDGFSRHRRILSESERIKGLSQRRPLDRRLAEVKQELAADEDAWRALLFRLSISGGALLLLTLFWGWWAQQRQRKQELSKLRQRITRDLHDEVGSSLGGISLLSEELESMAVNQAVKEELEDLTLMAREACSSLREVVWMTDQNVILLSELVEKLVERAERTLRGVKLTITTAPVFPRMEVALNFKRHLIMYFREAVHNCARHSGATEVTVSVLAEEGMLEVSVLDNGRGFDASATHSGWGLASMKKRAEELGGVLELISTPGEGTSVILRVPLKTLSKEPSKAYKTSNESE